MDESILNNIKKLLGIEPEDTHFDIDVIIHINTALMRLNQLGVGNGLTISDKETTWAQLIGTRTDLVSSKTYVYLKVRLVFDPPANSFLVEAMKNQITELEWCINVKAEGGTENE